MGLKLITYSEEIIAVKMRGGMGCTPKSQLYFYWGGSSSRSGVRLYVETV